MALIFHCSKCDKEYRVSWEKAGSKGKCKECGEPLQVPIPAEGVKPEGDVELAPNGTPVWRHNERTVPFDLAIGDGDNIERISEHIEQHLGPVAGVYHEIMSDLVHVDVHVVDPTPEQPFYRLVTSGMSDAPMTVPDELEHLRFAEVMVTLPENWKLEQKDFEDEAWYWPIRWIKTLARLPHEYDTWLGYGHTVPNGDPAEGFADNTDLCCALLLFSPTTPEEFHELEIDEDKSIQFYSFFPIYQEEMDFKLNQGVDELVDRFDRADILDVIDPKRKNVCKRGWKLW